jgi:predicted branched-subunit amino acid permease
MIFDRTLHAKWWNCLVTFTFLGVVGGIDEAARALPGNDSHDADRLAAGEAFAHQFWPCTLGGALFGLSIGTFAAHLLQRARPWTFLAVLVVACMVLAAVMQRAAAGVAFVLFVLSFVWFLAASGEEIPE